MKLFLNATALWVLGATSALGQGVAVDLLIDQQYFLPHEALIVKVRVTNYSGQTLQLGKDEDWLSFSVEGRKDSVISRLAPIPVAGEYTLESSRTGIKAVDLAPYFDLSRPGRYRVVAGVKIAQWQEVVQSEPKTFDIIRGTRLWEQEFGVPQDEKEPASSPEIRKYSLVQTIHQKHLALYLRLSDAADTRVFRVFPIGPMVSVSRPEPQLDRFNNLHLLYQISARSFSYSMVNPEGLLIVRETYDYADTKPALRPQEDGRIKVAGGVRRFSSTDLPPSLTSASPSDAGTPPR
ncbi:MAG: hypothetical protein HY735_19485 [Verrucomicrobia bacterium]|nr:hypothetical protein [Verrucomicrobiota bacterium]